MPRFRGSWHTDCPSRGRGRRSAHVDQVWARRSGEPKRIPLGLMFHEFVPVVQYEVLGVVAWSAERA
jgi:hypothetical protein